MAATEETGGSPDIPLLSDMGNALVYAGLIAAQYSDTPDSLALAELDAIAADQLADVPQVDETDILLLQARLADGKAVYSVLLGRVVKIEPIQFID